MADYDVVVMGAGCGGLTTAALLAKQGRKVLLLEQSGRIGGCCSTFEHEGYQFDLGASILEDIEVINWAFERLGTTVWDETELIGCDPAYAVQLADGTRMRYPLSLAGTEREIARIEPGDVAGWRKFAGRMDAFMHAALDGFFVHPANTLGDMVDMFAKTPALLDHGPLFVSSYRDVMEHYIKDERVRESLGFQSFYVGLPPDLCPGYFAMIPYSEHEGLYYTKGGMIGIPAALQRCGERFGLETRLNTRVEKVLVRNRRAYGVRLADGNEITADLVVSNLNAKLLYQDLIGEEHLPWLARVGVRSYEYSMATPMIYLGVDYEPPLECHHTLLTRPFDGLADFWFDNYKAGRYPVDQFGIVSWTSYSDPSLAPEGHHVLILTLAPGPYKLAGASWDGVKDDMLEQIIDYYDAHYIPGLKEHVKVAMFSTPVDFERELLSPEGAIYALRQDVTNGTVFRPAARSKSIKGLYLAGASTHPGGGVPTTIASGMIAADLIEKYE